MIKSPSSPLNPYSLATQNQTLPDPEFNELIIADGAAADIRELLHRSPLPALLLDRVSEPLSAITNALQDSQVHTLHLVAHGCAGGFMMGGCWVDAGALRESASLLAQWKLARIALWVCEAGADAEFVAELARLTGAEIHATSDFLGWVNNVTAWQLPLLEAGTSSAALLQTATLLDFPFQYEQAQSWRSQLTSMKFVNAYEVNTTTTPASKEQNGIDFNTTSLGSATVTDGTGGVSFSGNDVVVKLTINGVDHYGWISRPIKSQGVIKGFYFWKDDSFTDLSTATTDGNQDGDGDDADNSGFVLVVDQAYFDGLSATGSLKTVGSSSDRIDTSLNKLLPVNSAPVAVNDSAIFLEDSTAQTGNVLSNDTDANGNTLTVSSFKINGSSGTLGSAFTITGVGSFTLSSTGAYSFTPVANYAGAVPAITYIVSDGTLTSTGNLAIALTEVNDAPSGADKTITSQENQSYTFSAADFGFSDITDIPANALQSVVITTLPGAGTLKLNGSNVSAGNEVTLSDISKLIFTPATNAIGTGYASFTFQVRDDGGTSNSGINLDASANTLTFDITNVNSAPTAVSDTSTAVEASGASNATTGTNPTGNVLTNDTDPDSSDGKTVLNAKSAAASDTSVGTNTSIVGVYGTLVISTNGSYTYTVNNSNAAVEALRTTANTLTDTFNYTMKDTAGLKSSSTLVVTVQGANDNPNGVNDSAIAKESIASSGNYDGSDATGYKATGNVLNNDTDVDSSANGETSKTVAGLSGSATANVVGSANVSTTLTFTADNTLSPVGAGDEV
ncbi:MAG: VCBS repeat-containing protein, partial [Pseudohongiellaceae bacterium]